MIRIAIIDLYEGHPNQGMRCLREIINEWGKLNALQLQCDEFELRIQHQIPDLSYDIYISTGGPGSPLDGEGSVWEQKYFNWLSAVESWNKEAHQPKKHVFFICHSFQMACRHFNIAEITKRKSTAFGVFPVHLTPSGKQEFVFSSLTDPFYVVDSRDWQAVQPNQEKLEMLGAQILCIEKERPHVPYERAIMAVRFNDYMVGTQFHPEADAIGMTSYLQTPEKKETVIENHGEDKWVSIIDGLNDPEKIMWTYAHLLPNFLNNALKELSTKETNS